MPLRIDSHVHIMPPWRLRSLVRWILKAYPGHPVKETITADEILSDLKTLGISHFFNFIYPLNTEETEGLNKFNIEFCSQTAGAIAFGSMHQDTPDKATYAEQLLKDDQIVGFKFHPFVQRFDPWDQRFEALYEFLQEIKRPVVFHTGFELFYKQKMPIKQLEKWVKQYPELPTVFVHMAFPDFKQCFDLMSDFPELYLDATNVLAFLRPDFEELMKSLPDGIHTIDVLLQGIEQFSERVFYGSDYPVGMGALVDIYDDLNKAPLTEKAKSQLMAHSAQSFINRFNPGYQWENGLI